MFDLSRQIRLKQAKNALRDGRLDEAFTIATSKSIREHRGGQILLGRLVQPLLTRARVHLAAGRLRDARLDAERAIEAGGSSTEAVSLRREVEDALDRERRARGKHAELVVSARRHLQNGSLHAARERLDHALSDHEDASLLARHAENRQRRCHEAVEAAETHLERGEVFEALTCACDALEAGRRDGRVDALLARLKRLAVECVERHMNGAQLESAARLVHAFRASYGEVLETEHFTKALSLAEGAARAFRRRDYEGVRIELGRLQRVLPDAAWIGAHLERLDEVTAALRELRTGPIGTLSSDHERTLGLDEARATIATDLALAEGERAQAFAPRVPPRRKEVRERLPDRLLLWVDGVGTFLLTTGERVTIGRSGSSARPTIALAGNLAGHHAEILRVDDDYFLVAAGGAVEVDGRRTERKLLADGDEVRLGERIHLSFRQPTALSGSAVLALRGGQRLDADVQEVILVNENFIIGPKRQCHVQAPEATGQVVVSVEDDRLVCRARSAITVGGEQVGREAEIALGNVVEVGELTFTVTASKPEGI